jgi:hypothetical protein
VAFFRVRAAAGILKAIGQNPAFSAAFVALIIFVEELILAVMPGDVIVEIVLLALVHFGSS